MTKHAPVAVFDANLPTGLAFIRSLGRAGIPVTAFHSSTNAMGRHSRYATEFRQSPHVEDTDRFISWLATELSADRIGLVAPTSDSIMFHAACAADRVDGGHARIGHPEPSSIFNSLLKHLFADALTEANFPTPATATPTSLAEAERFVEQVGYPVVAKPRTHVGIGLDRGGIIKNHADLVEHFRPYDVNEGHAEALAQDPDLAWPLLQEFIDVPNLETVSVSGCIGVDGELLALDHSTKLRQWPPGLGIGTLFVTEETQPFTDAAVDAVRAVLGQGIFEFEVLYDPESHEYWGIDLNPRAFGQIALDIARGNDLPLHWYRSVTGADVADPTPLAKSPTQWRLGVPLAVDLLTEFARGDDRRKSLAEFTALFNRSGVGATADWADPLPALHFQRAVLRHPRGLLRSFLSPD